MGSITSRPKVPSVTQPQVVYMQTPAPTIMPALSEPADGIQEQEVSGQENIRRANLLTRNRGRIGTIRTSFRGLLGQAAENGSRKILLGE